MGKECHDCVNDTRLSESISIKDIVRLVLRSAVETGTPFIFNRDTVNRAQPQCSPGHHLLFESLYGNGTKYGSYRNGVHRDTYGRRVTQ
ncbi:MAG: hypothetical protein ACLULL_06170 [Parabacteroides distasonis]